MLKTCCIQGCQMSSDNDVPLFDFPASRLLRKRWMAAISPRGKLAEDALVCSRHFARHEYHEVRGRIRLKSKVVPSLFGTQVQKSALNDPLDLPEKQTEPGPQPDTVQTEPNHNDNRNGKAENINEKGNNASDSDMKCKDLTENCNIDKCDISKHNNDNATVDNDNGKLNNDNVKPSNNNGNPSNDNVKPSNDNGSPGNENAKPDNDNGSPSNDKGNPSSDNGKPVNDNGKPVNDKGKPDNDNGKPDNDNGKPANDNGKPVNDNVKPDNDNGKIDSDIVKDDKVNVNADKPRKRVKKKWVPMRKVPSRSSKRTKNGYVDLSEDSSDSVNSEAHTPPVLEDLEEQLPNYQIENKKTERQLAAMSEASPPDATTLERHEADPPPNPVFIELSVGQDSNTAEEAGHPSDCLMVLESVQCEIDPTLMLEAREEDEECLEQIDLDDDETSVEDTSEKIPRKSRHPVDPISLLTSSDEDDVILQEPHIDCLSVSDETDEDDVPLTRLIKTTPKLKKKKKSPKRKLNAQDIVNGVEDYYCMHCQRVSTTVTEHKRHLRTHLAPATTTRVYQVCKECGFTTSSKSQLYRHQRKHTTEKRYKCPLCSYRSKYNMSLMYHLKTHERDPNAYECAACGLARPDRRALLHHQRTCAALARRHACGVCGHTADTRRDLNKHRRHMHKA